MTHVERSGCRISYHVEGNPGGDVLLFSNSLGTTHRLWDRQAAALSSKFRIVRYDTRGHGDSEAPPGPYTNDMLGGDALAVLDAAEVRRAHVCGLSLGGLTAMWLGLHAPDRTRSLILSSTAARILTAAFWEDRIRQVRAAGVAQLAEASMGRWFTGAFRDTHPDVVDGYRRALSSCDREGYAACCAALRDADLRESIRALAVPVLAIAGREDPVTPPADAEDIAGRVHGARVALLDAAHLANVEQAGAFNTLVSEFISGTGRAHTHG